MSTVAKLIRKNRRHARLSQAELSQLAGTSQSALARYETGATIPTIPTLERLLAAAGRRLELRTAAAKGPHQGQSSVRGQLGKQAQNLRVHRRPLLDAARRHGARRVRVFGSLARGQEAADSDIDLLVDLDADRTLVDLAAFRREAEAILGSKVDVATADILKKRIREEAETQAVPL